MSVSDAALSIAVRAAVLEIRKSNSIIIIESLCVYEFNLILLRTIYFASNLYIFYFLTGCLNIQVISPFMVTIIELKKEHISFPNDPIPEATEGV